MINSSTVFSGQIFLFVGGIGCFGSSTLEWPERPHVLRIFIVVPLALYRSSMMAFPAMQGFMAAD